jgi:sodium-dependent phosphate cotransporter
MGKGFAESIFDVTTNPVVGLFIGILATAVIQSSSTSTSIVVGLAGAGILSIENAVPVIMGANIGTSVTNTIVSLAHLSHKEEFRKAFAGSTVHDFFNICSAIVLLPLEVYFGIISKSAIFIQDHTFGFGGLKFVSPIAVISKPVAKYIAHILGDIGWLSAIASIILLFIALRYIVKTLKSLVLARVERFFQRYIFRTPVLGFILGVALTVMVQSSSITTSLVIPLIGAGVISLHQIFPYVLGANIGTTVTAFLASFALGSPQAVSIAFAHLMFNIYGIAVFWPLKRIPIFLAEKLAEHVQRNRLVAAIYIIFTFFVLPGLIIFILR